MDKTVIIDCKTKETEERPLTDKEKAQRDLDAQEAAEREQQEAETEAEVTGSRLNLQGAIDTLRTWSDDARGAYDDWPGKSAGQKDATNREVIRRLGVFFDNFADLLTTLRINGG